MRGWKSVSVNRNVQIHPGELRKGMADDALRVVLVDGRPENEFNLFHLSFASRFGLTCHWLYNR